MTFQYRLSFMEQYWLILALSFRAGPLLLVHLMFPAAGLAFVVLALKSGLHVGLVEVLVVFMALFFSPLLYLLIAVTAWIQGRRYSKDITVTLRDESVTVENALATTSVLWDRIIEARETGRWFFVHITTRQAIVIPKRIIRSQDLELLRQRLRDAISDRAQFP